MYRRISIFGIAAVTMLAGCGQAGTDMKLSLARNELRQQCFGNDTYECRNKTIDFNIEVLESYDFKTSEAKKKLVEVFGDDAWDLYKEAVDETIEEGIELFDSNRPNIFARWFMGDSQAVSGKGRFMELTPQDLVSVDKMILKSFTEKAKKAGLKVDPRVAASYGVKTESSVVVQPTNEPAPPTGPGSDEMGESMLPTPHFSNVPHPTVEKAVEALVGDETVSDGGEEFTDGREILKVDLNGDGQEDAVVLFTIEGKGGAQNGYQTLAVFYQQQNGWQFKGKIVVNGSASGLKQINSEVVSISSLTQGPDDPDCCPSVETPQEYKWLGNRFLEVTASN